MLGSKDNLGFDIQFQNMQKWILLFGSILGGVICDGGEGV